MQRRKAPARCRLQPAQRKPVFECQTFVDAAHHLSHGLRYILPCGRAVFPHAGRDISRRRKRRIVRVDEAAQRRGLERKALQLRIGILPPLPPPRPAALLDEPQADDVLQIVHAAIGPQFVGKAQPHALFREHRRVQLAPQQAPCPTGKERSVPRLCGQCRHRALGIMARHRHHLRADAFQFFPGDSPQRNAGVVHIDRGVVPHLAAAQSRRSAPVHSLFDEVVAVPRALKRDKQLPRLHDPGVIGRA